MTPPRFFYFDLGNVLVRFDHHRSCRALADLTHTSVDTMREILFGPQSLQWDYEAGQIDCGRFCALIREKTGASVDDAQLLEANSAIFWPHVAIVPVTAHLNAAGFPLGILSNTCPAHWRYVSQGRYNYLRHGFDVHVLSFEVKAMKPLPRIYELAAASAGVEPGEIFFTDDRLENVEAAREAGWQAHHFTTVSGLIEAIRQTGVRTNL